MLSIDLNCDMGEGMPNDAAIMPYISSVNIACGFHAGDAGTIKQTIDLALQYKVAIGAHPGFNDKANFGRVEQRLTEQEYYKLVSAQLNIIQQAVDAAGATLHHVKPHGALYNMSAKDKRLASVIAKAVKDHNPNLILYGLSNSLSVAEAAAMGLSTASEVFADRTYADNGALTPRTLPNALIADDTQSMQQVLQMIRQQTVTSISGKTIPVKTGTVCIHGDGTHAASFAKMIAETCKRHSILIKAL